MDDRSPPMLPPTSPRDLRRPRPGMMLPWINFALFALSFRWRCFFLEVPSSSEAGRIRHELNTEKELRHSQPRWLTCSRVRSFTKLCSFRSCLCISSVDYMVSSSVLPLDRGSILCQCFLYSSADFCLCPSS